MGEPPAPNLESNLDCRLDQINHIVGDIAFSDVSCERLLDLRMNFEKQPPNDSVFLVDVFVGEKLDYSAARLRSTLVPPIEKAISQFVVKHVCEAVHSHIAPRFKTQKVCSHALVERIARDAIVQTFSDVWSEAALSTRDRESLNGILVQEIDSIWKTQCVPLIEAEKRSLQLDAFAVSSMWIELEKLLARARLAEGARSSGTDAAAIEAVEFAVLKMAKDIDDSHGHNASRIRLDVWMGASQVMWERLLSSKSVAWLVQNLPIILAALGRDHANLQALISEPPDGPLWRGIEVADSISDPTNGFLILGPSIGAFANDTGRAYVRYVDQRSKPRCVPIVSAVYAIREFVDRRWLVAGSVSIDFALKIINTEYYDSLFTLTKLRENVRDVLVDVGLPSDKQEIRRRVDEAKRLARLRKKTSQANQSDQQTQAPGGGAHSNQPTNKIPRNVLSSAITSPITDVMAVMVTPENRACSECVEVPFLIDYCVLHTALSFTKQTVHQSTRNGTSDDVVVPTRVLTATVDRILDSHRHRLKHEMTMDRLQQLVPLSVKKLISAGQRACEASSESLSFFVTYAPVRTKGELLLQIGRGSRDRSCLVFCFVCEALMRHMDSGWPLPRGLEWPKPRMRPPRKPKAKPKASQADGAEGTECAEGADGADGADDTEETAAASVDEIFGDFA